MWPVDSGAEPEHWFGRLDGWNANISVPVGTGDVVSVEHWQIQVRLSSAADLRTFHLERDARSPDWRMANITDGHECTKTSEPDRLSGIFSLPFL